MTLPHVRAFLALALLLTACMQVESTFIQISYVPSPSEATSSALDEMAAVFEGNYSREQIKSRLDESFARKGLEPTEENYRMAADVLIILSANAMERGCEACTEMAIIEVIISGGLILAEWDDTAVAAVDVLSRPPLPSGAIPQ